MEDIKRRGRMLLDALHLAGSVSEQSPSRECCVCFLSVCLFQSLCLSTFQQQDGQQRSGGWGREMDHRIRETDCCSELGLGK